MQLTTMLYEINPREVCHEILYYFIIEFLPKQAKATFQLSCNKHL